MEDPVTPTVIQGWCVGTIACWMTDYTDVLEDGRQRKIVELEDPDHFLIEVRDYDGHHGDRKFRISITVEEVE